MAKTRIEYNRLADILEKRIADRISRYNPDDKRLREGLVRIGIMVENETKKNIRRNRLIDTGALFNSIRYQLIKSRRNPGVKIGSWGIPYAAIHEFSLPGPVSIRAHTRIINKAFGKPIVSKPINVIAHTRNIKVDRSYLRPALNSLIGRIMETLRGLRD